MAKTNSFSTGQDISTKKELDNLYMGYFENVQMRYKLKKRVLMV